MSLDLYYQFQAQIDTADLIEWRAQTALGYAIRWITRKPVNHTSGALLLRLQGDISPEGGRRYIAEALGNGFRLNYLSNALRGYKGQVFWLRLREVYEPWRLPVARAALVLEGKCYDFLDLLRNAGGPVRLSERRVFCSEAWHIALLRAGLLSADFNHGLALRPGEFYKTKLYYDPVRIY